MQTTVLPALRAGKIVISVRSFISTLVYQQNDVLSPEAIAYLHSFMPLPDLVILYDLEAEEAVARIQARTEATGRPVSSPRESWRL